MHKRRKLLLIIGVSTLAIVLGFLGFYAIRNYLDFRAGRITQDDYNMPFLPLYWREGAYKPVIYLYPQEPMRVSVTLDYAGKLLYTYPQYQDSWRVMAHPDGTLINDADAKEYSYLFWEGVSDVEYDMSQGFVVKGEDTVAFLQEKLAYLGLTPREYNEMIVYWLPHMQDNAYNLITFQEQAYLDSAKLMIDPAPDSVLRIFMAFAALEKPIDIPPQQLVSFERKGFTLIEWGGTIVGGHGGGSYE